MFVAQFTVLDYLRSISLEHQATRTRGDLRQILRHMSLTAAMYHTIRAGATLEL